MKCADTRQENVRSPGMELLDRAEWSVFDSAADRKGVWIFPGLGARYVGMGSDLFGKHPVADALFERAERLLDFKLESACLEGSGRKAIPARQEAQLIYVVSCGYGAVLQAEGLEPIATAGHSLGNWAAGWGAGLYEFETGLELVTSVEELMERFVTDGNQAMGVVLGLDESVVESLVERHPGAWIANRNAPGQYVLSGWATDVDGVLGDALGLNAKRARRLPTERALHTDLMRDVSHRLRDRLAQVRWNAPRVPLISSADNQVLRTSDEALRYFGSFLDRPVGWESAVRFMIQNSCKEFIEVGPGNVLSGMFPYIERSVTVRTASELLEQDPV